MDELLKLSVGRPFRYKDADARLRNQEVFLLEWDKGGYMLIVALPGMTASEADTVKRNRVRVSAFVEGAYVLPLWRFVGSNLFGETPFDPTAYQKHVPESSSLLLTTNLVAVVGVDSSTMIVRSLRVANLPSAWLRCVKAAWQTAWVSPGYSVGYSRWLDGVISKFTVEELEQRAEYLGHLGDQP